MRETWSTSGVDLSLELDRSGGRRIGLEKAIRSAVSNGRLAQRARLPSTRALAAQLGLSRGTVSAAYDQLVSEGYLVARRGAGTEVADLALLSRSTGPPPVPAPRAPYDLRPGRPDVSTFPTSSWIRATRRALTGVSTSVFNYGEPQGRPELRGALADYLGRTRGVQANPDQIVLTSGYVQGLALLSGVLTRSLPAAIAMEDPNLPFHREVVRRAGGNVVGVPIDDQGIRTDRLGRLGPPEVVAVVVTPAHQYPLGPTLSPGRRHELIGWARRSGGLIIEDDYDGEFRYDRQPVGAIQGMAPDCVAYLGTASKTLGPALRLGWMVLPPNLIGAVVDAKLHADYQGEAIGQLVLADLLTTYAYDRHVRASRLRYRRRFNLLQTRLAGTAAAASAGFRLVDSAAGLHALLTFPAGLGEGPAVRDRISRQGLMVGWLGEHWHEAGDHMEGIVIGFATPSEPVFPVALAALERALFEG
ncbi:MAG TPA: PLP-dependent aminotransferase family protein [Candidatus Dormibacteraeota bacterium]|nr:PLP-dependent aminotransferase family protein [Candidatus Dormibacteraeota bacterium]